MASCHSRCHPHLDKLNNVNTCGTPSNSILVIVTCSGQRFVVWSGFLWYSYNYVKNISGDVQAHCCTAGTKEKKHTLLCSMNRFQCIVALFFGVPCSLLICIIRSALLSVYEDLFHLMAMFSCKNSCANIPPHMIHFDLTNA